METNCNNKKILKCLKSYLIAKKYYESDIEKSYDYFKQCNKILNDLKYNNIKITDNLVNIIEETETECSKYLTIAITNTLEKPFIKKINSTTNTNFDNNLFELIEIGDIKSFKNYKYGHIDFNMVNEFGLTLLHYAIKFGDTMFLKQAFKIGAGIDQTNKFGHTLLEYACLEKDPNIINFLTSNGADMKKHLLFREGKKYFNKSDHIDIALLEKIVLESSNNNNSKIKHLNFIFEYINPDEILDIGYCTSLNSIQTIDFKYFIIKLDNMIDKFNLETTNTYIDIIKEELSYNLIYKLGCPNKKIEIILYNLVPFIEVLPNLKFNWLISLEIKYLILKILKNKVKINTRELKTELGNLLQLSYINPQIIPDGLIHTIVLQWIYKIKV
jgi:hypothetical protein